MHDCAELHIYPPNPARQVVVKGAVQQYLEPGLWHNFRVSSGESHSRARARLVPEVGRRIADVYNRHRREVKRLPHGAQEEAGVRDAGKQAESLRRGLAVVVGVRQAPSERVRKTSGLRFSGGVNTGSSDMSFGLMQSQETHRQRGFRPTQNENGVY